MSVKAFFTVRGSNPVSVSILEKLREKQTRDPKKYPVQMLVFETDAEAYGASELEMVGLFDSDWYSSSRYSPSRASEVIAKKPDWLGAAYWAVLINPVPFKLPVLEPNASPEEKDRAERLRQRSKTRIDNCADQIRAMFVDKFNAKRQAGLAPWESPKKEERQPAVKASRAAESLTMGLKSMRCYA